MVSFKKSPYIVLIASSLLLTLFYILVVSKVPLLLSAHYRMGDSLFVVRSQQPLPNNHLSQIVVIGIDDESFERLNRSWPWGRELFALFLENIQKLNPKVIGIDFSFVGKSQNKQADQWLKDALAIRKNVILACYFDRSRPGDYPYVRPNVMFRDKLLGYGFINIVTDPDEINRRNRVLIKLDDNQSEKYAYGFSPEIAYAYLGINIEQNLKIEGTNVVFNLPSKEDAYKLTPTRVPLDRKYHITTSFRYAREQFTYIPFWKVIANQVSPEEIEGKIVLLGPVSNIFHDSHTTPIGKLPGIFINGNQILSILDQDFVIKAFPEKHWILLLLLSVFGVFIFYRATYFWATIDLICISGCIYFISKKLLVSYGILFGMFSAIFAVVIAFIVSVSYKALKTYLENATLRRRVIMDGLTGLYTRDFLAIRVESELKRSTRLKSEFFLIMIDIDHFKKVNDTYGHETGNIVLIEVAKILKTSVRGYDVAARYGGEEFSIMLFNCLEAEAIQIMDRIRLAIAAQTFQSSKGPFRVTISVGICSSFTPNIKTHAQLFEFADAALYQAKNQGRNQIQVYRSTVTAPPPNQKTPQNNI